MIAASEGAVDFAKSQKEAAEREEAAALILQGAVAVLRKSSQEARRRTPRKRLAGAMEAYSEHKITMMSQLGQKPAARRRALGALVMEHPLTHLGQARAPARGLSAEAGFCAAGAGPGGGC